MHSGKGHGTGKSGGKITLSTSKGGTTYLTSPTKTAAPHSFAASPSGRYSNSPYGAGSSSPHKGTQTPAAHSSGWGNSPGASPFASSASGKSVYGWGQAGAGDEYSSWGRGGKAQQWGGWQGGSSADYNYGAATSHHGVTNTHDYHSVMFNGGVEKGGALDVASPEASPPGEDKNIAIPNNADVAGAEQPGGGTTAYNPSHVPRPGLQVEMLDELADVETLPDLKEVLQGRLWSKQRQTSVHQRSVLSL